MPTAAGFRVKSGHAIAVVLAGPASRPTAIARYIVEMSDPATPMSRQPYHNRMFKTETNEDEIARRVAVVERCTRKSVAAMIDGLDRPAERLALGPRAVLVVGSVVDPQTLGSPHMRAHASEGRLFRTVLEDALRARGLECDVVVEKTLKAQARAEIGRTDRQITKILDAFGESLGRPWRAEEKSAATAAWLALGRSKGQPRT